MSLVEPSKKMSKSLGEKHYVGIFDDEATIRKKIRSAITDSGEKGCKSSSGVDNLFELLLAMEKHKEHAAFLSDYNNGTIKYSELKNVVSESIHQMTLPFREKRIEVLANANKYIKTIEELSQNNRKLAQQTLTDVRELVGLPKR